MSLYCDCGGILRRIELSCRFAVLMKPRACFPQTAKRRALAEYPDSVPHHRIDDLGNYAIITENCRIAV